MAHAAKHVVTDRKKSTARVVRLVRRNAASTARKLRDFLSPELEEGKPMPDVAYLQQLAAAALERHLRRLVDADAALHKLVRRDARLLRRRDRVMRVLRRDLGDLRTLVTGRLGREPGRRFLGLRGETSRDPMALLTQGDRAVARLRNLENQLVDADFSEVQRERWAAPLAEGTETLRLADGEARRSVKQIDIARLKRRQALAEFNRVFILIAGWFESHYLLIGRQDLADAVRPSKQYPGRTAAEMKKRSRPGTAEVGTIARLLSFEPLRRVARALGGQNASADGRR